MKEANTSIRSKLTKLILIISNISLLAAFGFLFGYEIVSYRQAIARQLEVMGTMLAQNSTAALAFRSTDDAAEILSSLRADGNITNAALYDGNDSLFVQQIFSDGIQVSPKLLYAEGIRYSQNYFEISIPVTEAGQKLGTLYIKRSTKDVALRLAPYIAVALGVLILCFLLTYFLSKRFERSISDPIVRLADTAKLISENQDYSVRANAGGDGEIGILNNAFNQMLTTIQGQNEAIQKHAQDLERKVTERTLEIKRQKDFAETVINSSLVLIAVFDKDMRFIGFNKRCEIEFGMKRDDVLGKRYSEAMPAAVGSPAYKAVLRALNGEIVHNEKYKSSVTGEYYENYCTPLQNERGEIYAALLTAHNITATVTANETLSQRNEELKRKNTELEQFAYVASHDLQEPLRKIQIFADIARKAAATGGQLGTYLEKIENSADRMSHLIKDVLEYSKLTKVQESFIETDLNSILDYVKSDFELLIAEKKASIESDTLPTIKGNKLQLHQLFANLINNALKFSDVEPRIKITTDLANESELAAMPGRNKNLKYCKILFADNGIGFDPQFKDKLFTIFQRLNPRSKYEGTGIGLALCKKIVENHDGHITVDSKLGEGTTFIVFLPLS